MAELKQPTFTGGEITPALYARVDLALYQNSVALLRNFIVRPFGGLCNRTGTRLIAAVKDEARLPQLAPFVFSEDQAYVIELGNRYARFFAHAGAVLADGVPYEIVTNYGDEHVGRLRWAQSGDILTLVHPLYAPAKLQRFAHASWVLEPRRTVRQTPAPANGVFIHQYSAIEGLGSDPTHPQKNWRWVVTAVGADESLPSAEIVGRPMGSDPPSTSSQVYGDRPVKIGWDPVPGATRYYVYRARNAGAFGFVGETTATEFDDDGQQPDLTDGPPSAINPWADPSGYPSVVAYYQDRLVYANTPAQPQTFFASRIGDYDNHDVSAPAKADDAYRFTIGAQKMSEIRGFAGLRQLLLLTASAEFVARNAIGESIGPSTPPDVHPETYRGCAWLEPLLVGSSVLFVQERSAAIRELNYDAQIDPIQSPADSRELSIRAAHLFAGHTIVDWAYAQTPYSVVWVVRDDGALLGLTYLKEHEVWGWHVHTTDGAFERVCVIPEGDEDAVYVIVRRTVAGQTRRFLERFVERAEDVVDAVHLDCALTYDGRNTLPATVWLVSPSSSWGVGDAVEVRAAGAGGVFLEAHAGSFVRVPVAGGYVEVQLKTFRNAWWFDGIVQNMPVPAEAQGTPTSSWSRAVGTVSGLEHLEGKTVGILADGAPRAQAAVVNGAVSFEPPGAVVHVGLPFVSRVETLALALGQGGAPTVKKAVVRVSAEVQDARGLWAGAAGSPLYEWKQRQVQDGYGPLPAFTGLVQVGVTSSWDTAARVALEQRDPLPLTVLSVIPRLGVGDA